MISIALRQLSTAPNIRHLCDPECEHDQALSPVRSRICADPHSLRRRTTPEAGFALEILGHAIEYLADEYVHEAGLLPSIHSGDPRVEAIQMLMAANREVYYACPVVPSLFQRAICRLFSR